MVEMLNAGMSRLPDEVHEKRTKTLTTFLSRSGAWSG
jgi:hypothetical protein